jgi:predicted O-methyltransferase YrrM
MRTCAETLASEMTANEQQSLRDALTQHRLTGTHLEIGTAAGGTLCNILTHYRDSLNAPLPPFLVIDPLRYFPDQLATVQNNLQRYGIDPDHPTFLKTSSAQAFKDLSTAPELDFILVDGNHKVHYVAEDLRWARHLRLGGLLCLHDYGPKFPGVHLNVQRFLRRHSNYKVHSQADSLLILQKQSLSARLEISTLDRLWAKSLAPIFQLRASIKKRLG